MTPASSRSRPRSVAAPPLARGRRLALVALVTAAILYGSLYPFGLQSLPAGVDIAAALWAASTLPPGSRGDLLANLLLYVPLGLFLALLQRGRVALRVAAAGLGGLVLSGAVEIAQLFVAGRTTSIWDLLLNTMGTLLGAGAALAGQAAAGRARAGRAGAYGAGSYGAALEPAAALLLLCWLGYRLYPYVPSLDLQEWRDSVKPVLLHPVFEPVRTLRLAVAWVVAARLLEAVAGRRATLLLLPAVLCGSLAAEVVIVDNDLTLAEVLGVTLALPGWLLLGTLPWRRADAVLLGALLTVVLADRLEPFRFDRVAVSFEWVPFRSLLAGHWGHGLQVMLQKLFLYGCSLWLARRLGVGPWPATALLALLLGGTSIAQIWIPDRSAEVTDVLLALIAAATLALLDGTRTDGTASAVASGTGWRARRTKLR